MASATCRPTTRLNSLPPSPAVEHTMHPSDAPTSPDTDPLVLYGQSFPSRLLLGTSRYPSPTVMAQAVARSNPAMLTASLRRQTAQGDNSGAFWKLLQAMGVPVLPNTAGCHSLQEAITTAEMAREVFGTDLIKLELHTRKMMTPRLPLHVPSHHLIAYQQLFR